MLGNSSLRFFVFGVLALDAGTCSRQSAPEVTPPVTPVASAQEPDSAAGAPGIVDAGPADVVVPIDAPDDPTATHYATQPDLLKLVWLPPAADAKADTRRASIFTYLIAPSPGHFNQGNRALANHALSKRACLEGLRGTTIQTEAQLAQCGAPNMVPVYANGDPGSAKVCIDVFEFPDQACELPFVWGSPSEAELACKMQGKRLCAQGEWNMACSADPEGKEKWLYAYGNTLDLAICNTHTSKHMNEDGKTWTCNTHDATASWATCATDTEPAGGFPKCRSRLGVYDQHGNVAEEMFRKEGDEVYTQLKGSAWFYQDVGREPGKPAFHPERESYPDTCNYDPRWHVEVLKTAQHVNYHLGFRCCKDVPPPKVASDAKDGG